MARPTLSALFSKFIFRETLSSQDKIDIRGDIGAGDVTLATDQTITGVKTFSGGASFSEGVVDFNGDVEFNYSAGKAADHLMALGAPKLSSDNTFSGYNTFSGGGQCEGEFYFNADVQFAQGAAITNLKLYSNSTFEYLGSSASAHRTALDVSQSASSTITTPTTGQTITLPTTKADHLRKLTPAGTLATLTLQLPTAANSRDCQAIALFSTQSVTALTVTPGSGTTMAGTTLTALVANTLYAFVYTVDDAKWNRVA